MPLELRWYRTLAWKFFLRSVLTVLAAVGIILWVAFDQAEKGALRAGHQALQTAGQMLDRQVQQETRILDAGLEVFVTQSANPSYLDEAIHRHDPGSARNLLNQSLENLKADFAFVVGSDGRPFATTLEGLPPGLGTATAVQMALDPDAAREAGRKGPSYMGFALLPHEGLVLLVTRPLRLPGGNSVGAFGVGLRLGNEASLRFRDIAIGTQNPPAHLVVMAKEQPFGSTLPAPMKSALAGLLAQTNLALTRTEILQGRRSAPLPINLAGGRYLAMFSPLRGEDGATLETATLLVLPLEPYLAPFRKIQGAILGAGIIGLLLAFLASLTSARGVTAPLARLTGVAQALAEGQRPDLAERPGEDEVGALTQAFRSLLSDLQAKEELLTDLARLRAATPIGDGATLAPGMSPISLPAQDQDKTAFMPEGGGTPLPAPPRLNLREGEVLGNRYRIESILGRGGMGVVLRVRDLQLDEDVALKVIRPELDLTPAFLEQLKQELKLARRITNRYVLRTHDFGEALGVPFVTMEFLKGITLRQLIDDRGRLPLALTLRIARQVAEGLEAAHAVGVVHRDIKPHNVFFDLQGDVKLLDFGLAAPVATQGAERGGHIFGTPRYMAPEQVRGEAVDPRTDLYALGVMLFELACGRPPFEQTELAELLRQHLETPPPPLQSLAPAYPAAFAALVARLLAKRQSDRPSSAAEVAMLLKMMGREAEGTRQI